MSNFKANKAQNLISAVAPPVHSDGVLRPTLLSKTPNCI